MSFDFCKLEIEIIERKVSENPASVSQKTSDSNFRKQE